jgi:hypothetical protein
MTLVAMDALVEFVGGQVIEELRENGSTGVHVPYLARHCGVKNGSNVLPI